MARENVRQHVLKKSEIKKIRLLREELKKEEDEYDNVIKAISYVSSRSSEFDELVRQNVERSIRIDAIKQKIVHLCRTGSKYGLSLEKDYIIFLQNRFDL